MKKRKKRRKFKVFITSVGEHRGSVARIVRELAQVDLKTALEIINNQESITGAIPFEIANEIKTQLEEVGATVEFKEL